MRRPRFGILTFLVFVLVGYNTWQTFTLKREIAALKAEVAVLKIGRDLRSSEPLGKFSTVMKAREHADEAGKFILRGDFKRAKAELEKSLRLIPGFSQTSGKSAIGTLDEFRRTWRDADKRIEHLWREVNKELEKGKAKGG